MNMPQRNAAVASACMTREQLSTVHEAVSPHRTVAKKEKLTFCHTCSNQLLLLTINIWVMLTGSPRMPSESLPIWFFFVLIISRHFNLRLTLSSNVISRG